MVLKERGIFSAAMQNRIMSESDINMLKSLLKAAANAASLEQFEEMIANL